MGNEELVLQANDIAAPADRLIMRNPGYCLLRASLISVLQKNKSFLSPFSH